MLVPGDKKATIDTSAGSTDVKTNEPKHVGRGGAGNYVGNSPSLKATVTEDALGDESKRMELERSVEAVLHRPEQAHLGDSS